MATTQDIKNQIAKQGETKDIRDLIQESSRQLGNALPSHMKPERIVRIALTNLRLNPKLYQCDPQSFLAALFQCAQLGLEPGIEGQSYLIPYNASIKTNDGWQKKLVVQMQVGYKGYVELFWRHQSSMSLQMETVHQHDLDNGNFSFDLGANILKHTPNMFTDRGAVVGYYAIAQLKGGGCSIKVMSKDEIVKHAKRFSKCWDNKSNKFMDDTPWASHFDAMAKKTVLIQLMKLLPKSIEIQHALAMDETVKFKVDTDMVAVPPAEIEHKEDPAVIEDKREPGSEG